jgi:hypothetical protein
LRSLLQLILRRSRLRVYADIVKTAQRKGYRIVSLEDWCENFMDSSAHLPQNKTLILRHDVDHMPSSALAIAKIESQYLVKSTFYFRWSTADKKVIDDIVKLNGEIGFHYETLSRYALVNGLDRPERIDDLTMTTCKAKLKKEIELFKNYFGNIKSIVHHGDAVWKKINAKNSDIIRNAKPEEFGIKYLVTEEYLAHAIDVWVSESTLTSVVDAIAQNQPVILFNSHPQYWVSGFAYLLNRLVFSWRLIGYGKRFPQKNLLPFPGIPGWQKLVEAIW